MNWHIRKNTVKKISPFLLLGIFILVACSNGVPMPDYNVDVDSWNKEITLSASPVENTFQIDDGVYDLDITVRRSGVLMVEFMEDFDVRIYLWKADGWELVENSFGYYMRTVHILAGERINIPIAPKLKNEGHEIIIRVMISGLVFDKFYQPGKTVGAFLDIALQP